MLLVKKMVSNNIDHLQYTEMDISIIDNFRLVCFLLNIMSNDV